MIINFCDTSVKEVIHLAADKIYDACRECSQIETSSTQQYRALSMIIEDVIDVLLKYKEI